MTTDEEQNLRIPGPTPLPPAVRQAMGRQMVNHRGPEYASVQAEVVDSLKYFFQTTQDVLLFAASGTGGLEASLVNVLSPGDRVLAVGMGLFGRRFAGVAEAFGLEVRRLEVPWGEAVGQEALSRALAEESPPTAVLLTANETSTGVMNDLRLLTPLVRQGRADDPLLLVDAVSALGAVNLPMDALGIDVLVTGSQKAWMAPPGMAMLGVSARAWQAHQTARLPRFYWDFTRQHAAQAKHQDAWTPAVATMFGLQAGLRMMRAEGRAAIFARHARIAAYTQAGLLDLGLNLFAAEGARSHTVTAAVVPDGVNGKLLVARMREQSRVVVAGGQDRLAGKIVRIGHMGWVDEPAIDRCLEALKTALPLAAATIG
jgi:aspartate aminotransferase-like enzyme